MRKFLATFGALGYTPKMSGTAGTLGGIVLYLLLVVGGLDSLAGQMVLCGLVTATAVLLAPWAVEYFHHPDPKEFVLDEVAGFLVTMVAIPAGDVSIVTRLGIAFAAFRLFDIAKPFPIRWMEGLPGGWGVTLDDVMAGCYANLAARAMIALVGA